MHLRLHACNAAIGIQLHPYFDSPFLVVSGLGRSGTTVLRHCVAAHPEINSLNQESNYLFALMRGANLAMENANITSNLAIDQKDFWLAHRQLILDLCWPANNHARTKALSTYTQLDPRAAIGLRATFDLLSIVFIVRNGIEVVSSYQSFDAFKHLSFEDACRNWSVRIDMAQYCRDNEHASLVRYEWITEDSERWESVLTEFFQQVGLDFHSDCRKPLAKRFHPTRFAGETRREFNDPSKRKERWRLWSEEQRNRFVALCGSAMDELGYPIPWI